MGVINKTTEAINALLDKVEKMPEEGVGGKTPVLETGETTTLDPGQDATSEVVSNGMDEFGNPKYKINFGIPRGADGTGEGGGGVADSVQWSNVLNKPTWVNSATKPSYTAAEVGALPAATTIPSKTSELDNDSGFVKSTELKTINGQSIAGTGNIEISGTGSGIADAPSDGKTYGRNNSNWVIVEGGVSAVDISDIFVRISQIAGIEGICTDGDYDTLKGYADNGTVAYVNLDGASMIVDIKNKAGVIEISVAYSDINGGTIQTLIFISANKKVSFKQNTFYDIEQYGSGLLGDYTKPSAYSAITKDDTISNAIGKLEAGISNGAQSNIYYIAHDVMELSSTATKEEILAALGGSDKKAELANAISEGKSIFIKGNKFYSDVPVSCYVIGGGLLIDLLFLRNDSGIGCEIVRITISVNCFVQVINVDGYLLNSKINTLTSESSSSDISSALGGFSGVEILKKAVEDGNAVYTTADKSVIGTDNISSRLPLSVIVYNDEKYYNIMISGVQADGILSIFNTGILCISYEISSNTFSCKKYHTQIQGL